MGKATPLEADLTRLKEKVQKRRGASDNPEGDAAIRSLRKRLKRAQRKRRRLVVRKQHAMGKKKEAAKPAAAS